MQLVPITIRTNPTQMSKMAGEKKDSEPVNFHARQLWLPFPDTGISCPGRVVGSFMTLKAEVGGAATANEGKML